jgi:chitinase
LRVYLTPSHSFSLHPTAKMGQGCSSTTTVQTGDLCGALASRCGISQSDFMSDNPNLNCNDLLIGQKVCCNAGGIPVPQQNSDGSCYAYTVQSGDYCSLIAANNGITVDQIESFNAGTWGWNGCERLQANFSMCLSTGTAPFPVANQYAVCGPTVPNTSNPGGSASSWATLNSCALNACCSAQGQCGTTPDYCTATSAPSNAPGSWASNTNGCISNCGTAITNNGAAPSQFRKIAYFENWALSRPCLNMDLDQLDVGNYTHVHYAFATVNSDFTISVPSNDVIFNQLVNLQGVKRIVSLPSPHPPLWQDSVLTSLLSRSPSAAQRPRPTAR